MQVSRNGAMVFLPEAHAGYTKNPQPTDVQLLAYAPGSDGFCLSPADILPVSDPFLLPALRNGSLPVLRVFCQRSAQWRIRIFARWADQWFHSLSVFLTLLPDRYGGSSAPSSAHRGSPNCIHFLQELKVLWFRHPADLHTGMENNHSSAGTTSSPH